MGAIIVQISRMTNECCSIFYLIITTGKYKSKIKLIIKRRHHQSSCVPPTLTRILRSAFSVFKLAAGPHFLGHSC